MARRLSAASVLVSVLIALLMVVTIPSPSPDTVKATVQATQPTTLRIGCLQKVDSLNPYVGFSDPAYLYYGLVYDALTCLGNDMEVVPNLALSWYAVPTDDPELIMTGEPYGAVWQYNLSEHAYFSDGVQMTADDVVFTVNLNAGNYTNLWAWQPYSYFMNYAEKVNDRTVRIHFFDRATGIPCPAAYANLISIPILPKHKLESLSALQIGFSWNGLFDDVLNKTVGTGPFMGTPSLYDEWYAGDHITLVRNPNCHWKPDYGMNISFDQVKLVFYDDAMAMSYALKNGDLDVCSLPPQDYRAMKSSIEAGQVSHLQTYGGPRITQYWTYVGFNMNIAGPHMSRLDPFVRWAMAMATNKTYICDQFYLGLAEPGSTLIPPINEYWHLNLSEEDQFPVDYDLANLLLTSYGYIDTNFDGIRECTASSLAVQEGWALEGDPLVYNMMVRREFPEEKQIAQYLHQEYLKIGIDLQIDIVDEVQLNTMVYYYQYDMVLWYWSSDPDPNYQLFVQTKASWGGWSDNMYYDPLYDENYTASVKAMDPAERKVYVDNCQLIHYLDAPYIILAYTNQTFVWRTDTFTGWGDWANDPGRSIENFWTGNPLWFELQPLPPPATASFTVWPDEGNMATVFKFNASVSYGNGSSEGIMICWDWESDGLADTGWSTSNSTEHQFGAPGLYNVTMTARNDSNGLYMNASRTVTVTNEAPEAGFWVSALMTDNKTALAFDASWSSDLETTLDDLEVRWDWEGDGTYDTTWTAEKTASHTFASEGTYNVTLQVRDAGGATSESVVRIMVLPQSAIPEFAAWIPVFGILAVALGLASLKRRRG